jgi:hypothetical protein
MCHKCVCSCKPEYLNPDLIIKKEASFMAEVKFYVHTDEYGHQGPFKTRLDAERFAEDQEFGDVICYIDSVLVNTRFGSSKGLKSIY